MNRDGGGVASGGGTFGRSGQSGLDLAFCRSASFNVDQIGELHCYYPSPAEGAALNNPQIIPSSWWCPRPILLGEGSFAILVFFPSRLCTSNFVNSSSAASRPSDLELD